MDAPQELVAVKVKVILLPLDAAAGTVYDEDKLFAAEKLPDAALHETLVCPWAVPDKLIVCPGHAVTGVVPASTVKG